jgi:hypothetical protein
MSKELEALMEPPSPDELARRQALGAEIRALREQIPPITPLTAADLVHMGRDDSFWAGEETNTHDPGAEGPRR